MHRAELSMDLFLQNLWRKTTERSFLAWYLRGLFWILVFFSFFYRLAFKAMTKLRRRFFSHPPLTIYKRTISVGNLTVGGTGKTPFIEFLVNIVGADAALVISSGYKSTAKRSDTPEIIGEKELAGDNRIKVEKIGDEATSLIDRTGVRIISHPSKKKAFVFADQVRRENNIYYTILDDGYQTPLPEKLLEILLLDGRAPFGNECHLPAGPLRERDLSRADMIVVTHADFVSAHDKDELLLTVGRERSITFAHARVFWGKHAFVGIYSPSQARYLTRTEILSKRWHLFAGIASFSSVRDMLLQNDIPYNSKHEFSNHCHYTVEVIRALFEEMNKAGSTALITTYKDWAKIESLLSQTGIALDHIFLIDMTFSFISDIEHERFLHHFRSFMQPVVEEQLSAARSKITPPFVPLPDLTEEEIAS